MRLERIGNTFYCLVTHHMPVGIVNMLEFVHIHNNQTSFGQFFRSMFQIFNVFFKCQTVGNAR
ncbi:Uncharacterised protein [Mycobacteroides abscessus subsp. abscessus]|nr:Uncharacterised protein [Mycobacteroides abscessus subsp. abscessus]